MTRQGRREAEVSRLPAWQNTDPQARQARRRGRPMKFLNRVGPDPAQIRETGARGASNFVAHFWIFRRSSHAWRSERGSSPQMIARRRSTLISSFPETSKGYVSVRRKKSGSQAEPRRPSSSFSQVLLTALPRRRIRRKNMYRTATAQRAPERKKKTTRKQRKKAGPPENDLPDQEKND